MGFETQEEAERWAENMEFLADQRKEERLLSDPPTVSEETLKTIERSLAADLVEPKDALYAAYVLGKFDGKLEMAKVELGVVEKAMK